MENLVWEYTSEKKLIENGWKVGVAVSGGPDSMALLVCMCALADRHGFEVFCVHFEHGIRGDQSLADADFVAGYCDRLRIPLYMGAADVPALAAEWKQSEETAAKKARERYFDTLVENGDIDVVATAHHMDDNAESILMHILRGSGLPGLAGIHSRNGNMIRPMLCVDSAGIRRYIDEKGIPFVIDETNADNRYTRNYVRNVLLPEIERHVNANAAAALNRLGTLVRTDIDYLEEQAEEAYLRCAARKDDDVRIDTGKLTRLHEAVAGRVIRLACAGLHIKQDIEYAHVQAVLALARQGRTGSRVTLSHDLCAAVEYGTLVIGFAKREIDYSFEMRFDIEDRNVMPDGRYIECELVEACDTLNMDTMSECFDLDKLPENITLRTRHNGDVIRSLNAAGSRKLKDYFIDKKLPRDERSRTPLLADGGNIIWIVGHVISDDYRVDENTRNIIQCRCCGREDRQ